MFSAPRLWLPGCFAALGACEADTPASDAALDDLARSDVTDALASDHHALPDLADAALDAPHDAPTEAALDVADMPEVSDMPEVVDPRCVDYCTANLAVCAGTYAQYGSMDRCLRACRYIPPGDAADHWGNTLGCRRYHTRAAVPDPHGHCAHAGPGGGGVCGADCEGYCTLAQAVCVGANRQYADTAACMAACAAFVSVPQYSIHVTTGDTLECRLAWLIVAATDAASAAARCPSIAPRSPACR